MKMSNIWFGWILVVGIIAISGVSATPGDTCTNHSHCEAGEYCYDAGACSQCFNNNVCAIYGNSIDGDCSKCSTSSSPSSSTALLDSGSAVIGPLDFEVNPNSGTGLDCIKYTITLTDGVNSDILAGVFTLENGNAIVNSLSNYASVDVATNDMRSKLVPGSECLFALSATCTKVVALNPLEIYVGGIANKGSSSEAFSYTRMSCTDAEAASVSSGITLHALLGLTSAIIVALVLA